MTIKKLVEIADSEFNTAMGVQFGQEFQIGDQAQVPFESIVFDKKIALGKVNKAHVKSVMNAIKAGRQKTMSVHAVRAGDDLKLRLVKGKHTFEAIKLLIKEGVEVNALVEFVSSNEVESLYHFLESTHTRRVSAVTRGLVYERLIELDETQMSIAERLTVSQAGISNHMMLSRSGDEMCALVDGGKLKQSQAITLLRQHGPDMALKMAKAEIEHSRSNKGASPFVRSHISLETMDAVVTQLSDIEPQLSSPAVDAKGNIVLTLTPELAAAMLASATEAKAVNEHNLRADKTFESLGVQHSAGQGFIPTAKQDVAKEAKVA